MGSGILNSGPHANRANALPIELSLHPLYLVLLPIRFLTLDFASSFHTMALAPES